MEENEHDNINIHTESEIDDFLAGRIMQKIEDEDITLDGADCFNVYDETSRNEAMTDYTGETLFAFESSFLAGCTGLPEKVFEVLSEMSEEANEPIEEMIEATCGMDSFIEQAVDEDGYGHFLSAYDGEENEVEVDGTTYYIYRN